MPHTFETRGGDGVKSPLVQLVTALDDLVREDREASRDAALEAYEKLIHSLRDATEVTAGIKRARKRISTIAPEYLEVLCAEYLRPGSTEQSRRTLLQGIADFVDVSKASKIRTIFFQELTAILEQRLANKEEQNMTE